MALRDWITKDFGWKLFSLILAVAFWIAIHRNIGETPAAVIPFASVQTQTITFTNLPVHVVSSSADVHNAQVLPNAVTVTLRGPSEIMSLLEENRIHATANLTGIDLANDRSLPVEVSVPLGVAVDKIDPPKVSVTYSQPTE
jgi:YbbR domain-containing protein